MNIFNMEIRCRDRTLSLTELSIHLLNLGFEARLCGGVRIKHQDLDRVTKILSNLSFSKT